MSLFIAECEGGMIYNYESEKEVHVKKFEIFKVLDEKRYQEIVENDYQLEGDFVSSWEMVDLGILEDPEMLFREGWDGDFYSFDYWIHDCGYEFTNGTTDEKFDEFPEFKTVDSFEELEEAIERDIRPTFYSHPKREAISSAIAAINEEYAPQVRFVAEVGEMVIDEAYDDEAIILHIQGKMIGKTLTREFLQGRIELYSDLATLLTAYQQVAETGPIIASQIEACTWIIAVTADELQRQAI